MKGSILFNKDINIEVDVDPSAEEGARLISAKNLVDGQEAGGGGGGIATVTLVNNTGDGLPDWQWCLYLDELECSSVVDTSSSGTYKCLIGEAGQALLYLLSSEQLTLEGSAELVELNGDPYILVTGDCTITIAAE